MNFRYLISINWCISTKCVTISLILIASNCKFFSFEYFIIFKVSETIRVRSKGLCILTIALSITRTRVGSRVTSTVSDLSSSNKTEDTALSDRLNKFLIDNRQWKSISENWKKLQSPRKNPSLTLTLNRLTEPLSLPGS